MNKIFTILLIALSSTLFAQDQVAKDVLDKLSATTKSYKNMTIGFDFIFENTSQNIKENQKGILILEDDMMSPNKLFTIYEKGYKYTYVGAEAEKGKRLQIINLFPEESGAFMKITLAVDAAKNQLHKIIIHDKNGGTYTYLITAFSSNTTIKPFTFNAADFPGAEEIDLR